jgi:hypothetical protein
LLYTSELPPELSQSICISLELDPREYLFVGKDSLPYQKATSWGAVARKILQEAARNDNITINSIRHACATSIHTNLRLTGRQKEILANKVVHGLAANFVCTITSWTMVAEMMETQLHENRQCMARL